MKRRLPYVIARRWVENEPFHPVSNCLIYAYGCEIQHGDEKDAQRFLEYVTTQTNKKDFKIYWLDFRAHQ